MLKERQNKINRRNFFKSAGAAGLAPALAGVTKGLASAEAIAGPNESNAGQEQQKANFPQVPKRKLGKTGVEVPCLALGTNRLIDNQILLRQAFQRGVSYWDTGNSYTGGNAELTIGKFLSKNPELRKKLFIVTKASGAGKKPTPKATVAAMEQCLQTSLKRMNTNYIDLYYGVHGLEEPAQLTNELEQWAKDAKKRELIRFFGFSTHKNIAQNLTAATKLDWIDAIMTSYNFRLMQDPEIQAAIGACHKAGMGIIAMKTIALSRQERRQIEAGQKIETEEDKKLLRHFLERGLTVEKAKIKFVLEDKRISSACVGMSNIANLRTNVEAALDRTELTQADREVLKEYAEATGSGYCAGCAHVCDSALPAVPYVSDIMRYLMYYNSYSEKEMARELFAEIPRTVRNKLLSTDYSLAEARCPQHLPIGELIAEAVSKLA